MKHDAVSRSTIEGFGEEWATFDQTKISADELQKEFESYFAIFPLDELRTAEGFDLGCGSGRWAAVIAPQVGKLHCIDPAEKALEVARSRLGHNPNVEFHLAGVDSIPLADGSQDFGYSVGVLHHTHDAAQGLKNCVAKLKPGAPFLVYLYYNFDNRPAWYRPLWKTSELGRAVISRLPFGPRRVVSEVIAATVYYPLTRIALAAEKLGANVSAFPLSHYRDKSYYKMRTDALDRFGTRLEHRFSRREIERMMTDAGLEEIRFSDTAPFWVACGRKKAADGAPAAK